MAAPQFDCTRVRVTPEGQTILAALPSGISGHFGADLRRFVLLQHHQGQVTVERLTAQLRAIGFSISKRQVMRLLIDRQDRFLTESRDVRAGLQRAAWISVDDTGAQHAGNNGFCTQIGNDSFAWFGTRSSKSRLNFLDLLRAGRTDYVINHAAIDYMRGRALAGSVIAQLAAHRQTRFVDQAAWQAHLDRLGISTLRVMPDSVQIATEGALWGSVQAHGFLREAVVISDDAGQFAVGRHALCWVHAERLVHKLDTFTDLHRAAQQRIRALIWWFYADLKAYCAAPTARRRSEMRTRFDRIFHRRTGFVTLDRLLQQQGRAADRARQAGDPAAHQWLRARHSLSRHQAQDQRWHAQRHRTRLPRCFPRPDAYLYQTRHSVLGLSRRSAPNAAPTSRALSSRPHRQPLTAHLSREPFCPSFGPGYRC
jgi:hypothetical protein